MNKLFAKIASITAGLALIAGAGVALASHAEAKGVKAADESVDFTAQGYTNQQAIESYTGASFSIAFDKGTNSNAPKYYTSGTAIRVYGGNYFTVSSSSTITAISLTFGSSDGTNEITTDVGSFTSPNWSGSADAVKFTIGGTKGNRRLAGMSVTTSGGQVTNVSVTGNIEHGSINKDTATVGASFSVTISPDQGYAVPESLTSVTMGGEAVTDYTYQSGTLTISEVTDDIEITASCVALPQPEHAGTQADPYTVEDAIKAINLGGTYNGVYVSGYITGLYGSTPSVTSDGKLSYWIADTKDGGNQFEVYKGKNLNNEAFEKTTDIEIGAFVVIYGDLTKYNSTYELKDGNYIVSYDAPSKVLTGISVSGAKTDFEVGEEFSSEGLIVTGHYQDAPDATITSGYNVDSGSVDIDTAGKYEVVVTYETFSDSYEVTYAAPLPKYTVSFLPGEGSGTMESVQVKEGEDYTLPECSFTAPEGKVFDHWADENGNAITVIEDIDDDYVAYATWKDAPSEVDATMAAGTNGSTAKVVVGELEKDAIKVGTSSKGGDMTITVGAGAKYVKFYAAAWKGVTGLSLNITGATVNPSSVNLTADDGISNSSPFTLSGNEEDFLFTVYLSDISSETTITLTTSTTKRFVLWGAVYGTSGDVPQTPTVESIELSNIQTEYEVGDEFVMPTVTAHYDDESSKVVTNNLNQTGFDSSAAATGQQVTVSYTEGDVTVYATAYSVNISEPTPAVTATYKKVKTNLADFTGDYLIVFEDESALAMDGSLTSFGAGDYFSVVINNEVIEASEDHEFHIAAKEGGYSIQAASGKYIGKTADSNGVDANDTDKYVNQISYVGDETSDIDIVAESEGHLRCNGSDHRIVFYKGSTYTGQKAVALYQKVDEAEAFALDILNLTEATCSAQGEKSAYESAWTTLATKYTAVTDKSKLVDTVADANGVMLKEALARYDYLVARFGLDNFIDRSVAAGRYVPAQETALDSNAAIVVVTIVAITSISAIGVILVIKRRKAIR